MDKLPPLAKWSPKELVEIYSSSYSPTQEFVTKQFPKVKEALFRLGTNLEMKACWEKLLSTKANLPNQEKLSGWLTTQIYSILIEVFVRSDEGLTPQFKRKEIEKIVQLVNKLIVSIHNSNEALQESFFTVPNKLSEDIIKKYPEKSMRIGFEEAPISAWSFISGIRDTFELSNKDESLKPFDWNSWDENQKRTWLVSKLNRMDLTSLLRVYLEQLNDIPTNYASDYIASNRSVVTKQLFKMMHGTFGEAMTDCVVPMVNAILDLELGIEDITPYKPKEKIS